MARGGLRNEEINLLTRELRDALAAGLGPEEAWLQATQAVPGVEPSVFDGWRPTIFAKAKEMAPAQPSGANLVTRNEHLLKQVSEMSKKLAEMGEREEAMRAAAGDLSLVEKYTGLAKKYDDLVADAKARIDALKAEIAELKKSKK